MINKKYSLNYSFLTKANGSNTTLYGPIEAYGQVGKLKQLLITGIYRTLLSS